MLEAMKVNVNNKDVITSAVTLAQLADELALPATGVAVGVNGKMVPRTMWTDYALAEGMNVVVIKAACGG